MGDQPYGTVEQMLDVNHDADDDDDDDDEDTITEHWLN